METKEKYLFTYDGPIFHFDRVVCNKWQASTMAVSESKALSNLSFKAKKHVNLIANTRVTLDKKKLRKGS